MKLQTLNQQAANWLPQSYPPNIDYDIQERNNDVYSQKK
jgi:hypothetical protein